jgi:hypothetical protein
MPNSDAPDHHQRLRVLIKEFFEACFLCFIPDWAARFEFVEINCGRVETDRRFGREDYRRFLLAECLQAYAELDEPQNERLQALLHAEAYREVQPFMKTPYERGIERGIEQGERRSALRQMEAKFGPLTVKGWCHRRFDVLLSVAIG